MSSRWTQRAAIRRPNDTIHRVAATHAGRFADHTALSLR